MSATTWTVCSSGCDFTSIQDAVDYARAGDSIEVWSGTYVENVDVNKRLNIYARDGPLVTTLIANLSIDPTFEITTNNVSISGFTVEGSTGRITPGIYLYSVKYCNISMNNIINNSRGIELDTSRYNVLSDNNIESNTEIGINLYYSSNNKVENNTVSYTGGFGIDIYSDFGGSPSDHNVIKNNELISNNVGIRLVRVNRNIVEDNIIRLTTSNGTELLGSNNNIIRNNNISNGGTDLHGHYGIFSRISNHNVIENNYVISNKNGIQLYYKDTNNTIRGNIVNSNSLNGIEVRSDNNSIIDNIINSNSIGIRLSSADYNIIVDNNIILNSYMGIFITPSDSYNNTIYHNNFINNTNQAYDDNPANNDWHHPTLLEGNYWSDYTGVDDGSGMEKHAIVGDSIGDTLIPYPSANYDYYPFINPNGWITPPKISAIVAKVIMKFLKNTIKIQKLKEWFMAYYGRG